MIHELRGHRFKDIHPSIHQGGTYCRRFQAKCAHKAVWSHSNRSLGSDVRTSVTGALRYQVVFLIADTSPLLLLLLNGSWERRRGRCVKKNNQAVTHEHLSVSQFLIEQASHTKHTQAHTHTHVRSQTLWSLFFVSFSLSFPSSLSLTL